MFLEKTYIEYSIVSIGTENAGSHGYMSVTEACADGNRYICPLPHFVQEISKMDSNYLKISNNLSIKLIALARFQLIAALGISYVDINTFDNICVVGAGAIGVTAYLELVRFNKENISILTRREFNENYLIESGFKISSHQMSQYDCIIECTGEGKVLSELIEHVKFHTTILLMGTPRNEHFINGLSVQRKNLTIIGCHELNGIGIETRQNTLNDIVKWYELDANKKYNRFVHIHKGDKEILRDILTHKFEEPIHVLEY